MSVDFGDSDALEEVEGGAEAGIDAAADEEARATVEDAAEVGGGDAGLAEEEGEDGGEARSEILAARTSGHMAAIRRMSAEERPAEELRKSMTARTSAEEAETTGG